jgi:hypothetical protein
MTDMARSTFERGGHLGNDPFGYRTVRDGFGQVAKPRTLEIVDAEADVVRRVFRLVAIKSTAEVARQLQREGVKRRAAAPWTKDAVKDIVRRDRVYLGNVVYRRGTEELAGRHPAIIDERTWATARRAIAARQTGASRASSKKRVYLLSGLIECECGGRLHGQTRSAREAEWRYYLCRRCGRKAIAAGPAEAFVLDAVRSMSLPPGAVESAREELRRRLALPGRSEADALRARLEQRLSNVMRQYEWGDIDESAYRAKMTETRAELAALPEPDKVVTFDGVARIVSSLVVAIDAATPEQLRELVRLVVDRVTTRGGRAAEIELKPAARPFFASGPNLLMAPPDGLEPPTPALGRLRSVH